PRPNPRRRRASSALISSTVTVNPAGSPSMMTTRARPWDSPAVRKRSTWPIYWPTPTTSKQLTVCGDSALRHDAGAEEDRDDCSEGEEGPEGDLLAPAADGQQHHADDR